MDAVIRPLLMYVFLLLVFSIAGKRSMAEMDTFDMVTMLIISEATQNALLGQNSSVGGLGGLLQAFQKIGLGGLVNSWVSSGKNLAISPDHIKQGLGSDVVKQLAAQAGLSSDAAGGQLADLLPGLIDKLTPGGKMPDSNLIEQGLNLLRGKLG